MVCLILDLPENGCKGTNNNGNTQRFGVKLTFIYESKLVEERWHLRDDEQFDLAAWFLSLIHSWSRVASFFISLCSACR